MQFGKLWESIGYGDSASISDSIEEVRVSHLVLGVRASAGGPTATQLKNAKLRATLVRGGLDVDLVEASLYDLACLTDMMGGYGRDWKDTDLTDVNIVIPMGLDLSGGGTLKVELSCPDDVANTVTHAYYVYDGTMPPVFKYTTQTTSGTASFKSAMQIFTRNETGDYCVLEIDGGDRKEIPYNLGRILFANEAKIESETAYAKIFTAPPEYARNLKIRCSQGAATIFSIELP